MVKLILTKFKEALLSVLPITLMIVILNFTIVHMPLYCLIAFIVGFIFLVNGVTLFSLGADISMIPMGNSLGEKLITKKKLWLLLLTSFLIGFLVTIAEPDLMVLAGQFKSINKWVLICSVGFGVGLFLMISTWRVVYNVKLRWILISGYILIFGVAIIVHFIDSSFFPIAFDSGGVTTGPITVPFILAFGLGLASNTKKSGKEESDSSFGAVSICSMGPIIAVLILRVILKLLSKDVSATSSGVTITEINDIYSLLLYLGESLLTEIIDVSLPILLIVIIFLIFQVILLKIDKKSLVRILLGLFITYIGLVLFLSGAKVGFMNVGTLMGESISSKSYNWILIPLGALIGFFVVMAEPSVHVLTKQVESITNGAISKKKILFSLAIGVGISISLAMVRIICNVSLWWFLIPCYFISIILIFFVPEFFTAIAFDSGGVASGPLTSTFILPLTMGACSIIYINDPSSLLINSFGVVSLVAMTPLITIQLLGLNYKIKMARFEKAMQSITTTEQDDEIITFKKKG